MQMEEIEGDIFLTWVHSTTEFDDNERREHNSLLLRDVFELISVQYEEKSYFRVHVPFIHWNNLVDVLQKKISFAVKQNATFHPFEKHFFETPPMDKI